MRHDECYERDEYLDCICDARLIKDISELRREELSPEETTKAALILRWFIDSPCVSPGMNNPLREEKMFRKLKFW